MARIAVLGGGFGGCAAAAELRTLAPDDEVVLVASDDRFAMGFAKLWDLAGQRSLADGTRLLGDMPGVEFRQAEVTGIDPTGLAVATSEGDVEADAVLVALGARPTPAHRQLIETAGGHDLYDPAALPAMKDALARIDGGRVVVSILGGPFKCPPAPYEAALLVDDLLRARGVRDDVEIVLTTPQPMTLPAAGVDASRFVAGHLGDRGIELRERHRVVDVDPDSRALRFADDNPPLAHDLLLAVPADAPPAVVADSVLAGEGGWIRPDPATLATEHAGVWAVGDCTVVPTSTGQLPHAGVFAAAQARVAASNAVAALHGGDGSRFDGHGYCFLELPGEQVAFVEGDFFADPPDVVLSQPDHAQFLRKQAYERDNLTDWFGA